jgi:septum formation inhibitor MinC
LTKKKILVVYNYIYIKTLTGEIKMAEENNNNDFTVSVNDKEHKFSDLSSENKQLVAHIRDLEAQLGQVAFRHEQLTASKNFFSDKLVASLSESSSEEASAEAAESSSEEKSDS